MFLNKIKRKHLVLILGLFVSFVFLTTFLSNKPSSVYFSLNDKNGYYSIVKSNAYPPDRPQPVYAVVYGPLSNKDFKAAYITVGNSGVELEGFLGKDIIITGSYSGRVSNKQCIAKNCYPIGGDFIVIDIEKVQERK